MTNHNFHFTNMLGTVNFKEKINWIFDTLKMEEESPSNKLVHIQTKYSYDVKYHVTVITYTRPSFCC
jgi:hypothetical protein